MVDFGARIVVEDAQCAGASWRAEKTAAEAPELPLLMRWERGHASVCRVGGWGMGDHN